MTKLKSLNFLWLLMIVPLMFLFTGCGDKSVSQLNKSATCETQAESAYTAEGASGAYAAKITTDGTDISNDFSKGYRMTMKMNGEEAMNCIVVGDNLVMKMDVGDDTASFKMYIWKKDSTLYVRSEYKDGNGNNQKVAVKYTMTPAEMEAFLTARNAKPYSVANVLNCITNTEGVTIKAAGENSFKIEFREGSLANLASSFDEVAAFASVASSADIYVNFNSDKTIKSMKVIYNAIQEGTATAVFELIMSEYNGSITFPKDSDFEESASLF